MPTSKKIRQRQTAEVYAKAPDEEFTAEAHLPRLRRRFTSKSSAKRAPASWKPVAVLVGGIARRRTWNVATGKTEVIDDNASRLWRLPESVWSKN